MQGCSDLRPPGDRTHVLVGQRNTEGTAAGRATAWPRRAACFPRRADGVPSLLLLKAAFA